MSIGDLLRELRPRVEALRRILLELEELLNRYSGGPRAPPSWEVPRIFVWYEVYVRGGIVSRDELHEIARRYGYDTRGLGGFFTGDEPSLEYVGVNKDRVVLREWAQREVELYREWIEQHKREYERAPSR